MRVRYPHTNHQTLSLDIDKGVTKLNGVGRVPFVPDGPDTELYKRLMQVLPYVDGRQAVPVEVIPQHAIDKRISPRYLSVEERELIADLYRQGLGVRAIARHLGRSPGTISKEMTRNRDELGLYLPHAAHRKGPDPRKVDTSGVSYAAWVSVADVSASKSLGARRLHQECRLRVL